jgi:multiple sugar transport system substrate-binding protein
MNKTKDLRNIVLVIALLATALSACGPSQTPEGPVVITFAAPKFVTAFTRANFEELVEAFNKANPDVEVRLRTITTQEAMRADDPYSDIMLNEEWGIDVFFSHGGPHTKRLAESDRIINLQHLVEAEPGWELDDFYPSVLAQFQHEGNLWGIPTEFAPLVVFYNKELFDEAGVAYPQPDWTRDDFLAKAKALKEALPERYFPFAGVAEAAMPFIYAHGGSLLDKEGNCTLGNPSTIEALKWYFDLALVHQVMPTLPQAEAYEPELPPNVSAGIFVTGNGEASEAELRVVKADARIGMATYWGDAAVWILPLWEQGEYWRFRWGIVPLPRDKVEVTLFNSFGCYITAHCKHPEEALRWIHYLTRHRVYIFGIPARRSVAQGEAFREVLPRQIDREALDLLLARLEKGQSFHLTRVSKMAPHCLGDALIDIYERGLDVETALQKAQERLSGQ